MGISKKILKEDPPKGVQGKKKKDWGNLAYFVDFVMASQSQ